MVVYAGQPEIFRAVQRDETFQQQISDAVCELALSCLGIRRWISIRQSLIQGSKFVYLSLTTLSKIQTLGEEYTGIVHWSSNGGLPTMQIRMLMVLLECFGVQFIQSLLTRFEVYMRNLPDDTDIRPEAKEALIQSSENIRKSLPFLIRLHKSIFYLQGKYYSVSKRVTGVRYALARFWLRDRSIARLFRVLGVVTLAHEFGSSLLALRNIAQPNSNNKTEDFDNLEPTSGKCALCLNYRRDTSCTPCGHLFCWTCIATWLMEQPFCPICREATIPSRVVLLKNL